jgi:hypothetical protein
MDTQTDILTEEIAAMHLRRSLLPLWIKVFIWFFMVIGALGPVGFVAGIMLGNFRVAIFGFDTTEPLSFEALLILGIFIYNGIIAYRLWAEKRDAVDLALYSAYLSVALCIASMVIAVLHGGLSARLELVLLFLYITKLKKIKELWSLGISKSQFIPTSSI